MNLLVMESNMQFKFAFLGIGFATIVDGALIIFDVGGNLGISL